MNPYVYNILFENGNSFSRVCLPKPLRNANVTQVQVPMMPDIDLRATAYKEKIVTVIVNATFMLTPLMA